MFILMDDSTGKTCFYKLIRRHFKMCAHVVSLVLVSILLHKFGVENANTICLFRVSIDTSQLGYVTSKTLTFCQNANLNFTSEPGFILRLLDFWVYGSLYHLQEIDTQICVP